MSYKTTKRRSQRKHLAERLAKRRDWLDRRRHEAYVSWLKRYREKEKNNVYI